MPSAAVPATRPLDIELMRILDEKHMWTSIEFKAAHIGAVFVLDGTELLDEHGELRRDVITERMDAAIQRIPELSKRIVRTPLGVTTPVWVPDTAFDVRRHLVFAPGVTSIRPDTWFSLIGLDRPPLDLSLPVWDATFTRLESGDIALGIRLHHVMGDARWALETLTLVTDTITDTAVDAATDGAADTSAHAAGTPVGSGHAAALGRAPRTRWAIPFIAGRRWVSAQSSVRGAWADFTRVSPPQRRARRTVSRNIRPLREWWIRRKNLAAIYLPPLESSTFSVPLSAVEATAAALGASLTSLVVAATMNAVDDDARGLDLYVPASRRVKGDRTLRNDVSMFRVHAEPGATIDGYVGAVNGQLRRFIAGKDDDPARGRKIGYATFLPWSDEPRSLLGARITGFFVQPGVDARDELNAFALSYNGTLSVTLTGRAGGAVVTGAERAERTFASAVPGFDARKSDATVVSE